MISKFLLDTSNSIQFQIKRSNTTINCLKMVEESILDATRSILQPLFSKPKLSDKVSGVVSCPTVTMCAGLMSMPQQFSRSFQTTNHNWQTDFPHFFSPKQIHTAVKQTSVSFSSRCCFQYNQNYGLCGGSF